MNNIAKKQGNKVMKNIAKAMKKSDEKHCKNKEKSDETHCKNNEKK